MLSYLADIVKRHFSKLQFRLRLAFIYKLHDELLRVGLNQE
jgi:hypothetical protein